MYGIKLFFIDWSRIFPSTSFWQKHLGGIAPFGDAP